MKLIVLALLGTSLFAQTTINVGTVTVPNEVSIAIETYRLNQALQVATLVGAINSSVTSLTVSDSSTISVNDQIVIDNEAMNVTAKTGAVLTVTRAATVTVAAAHASGVMVKRAKHATAILFIRSLILTAVNQILAAQPSSTIATQQAAIVAAQAAIESFKATAVQ